MKIRPHFIYSKGDFVIDQLFKPSIFDSTLFSSWKFAETNGALNYKIKECEVVSKIMTVNSCRFIVTLNEKRFSKRRIPQEIKSLNQPFDNTKFNFTKVKEDEILMTIGLNTENYLKRNLIIVNASPFQEGHSLLVPEIESCHNQLMREEPLRTALETILISGERNFTAAFNSLLACASVNHLHFHLWVSGQPLVSSLLDIEPLIEIDNDTIIFHMTDHPIHNLVVVFTEIDRLDRTFKILWNVVTTFQRLEMPHSICFVRSKEGLRAIIWPRRIELDYEIKLGNSGNHDIINVAAAELAGEIYTGDRELFNDHLDCELLERSFSRVNVSIDSWNEIISNVEMNIRN